ncbi:MAG: hypothetical protein IRZ18_09130 [Clostridia bacterium]|nr:hypothetical protein [Clostridia bacterium]
MARRIAGCYIPPDREAHLARHGVSPEEVHEVLENRESPPLWLRRPGRGTSPFYVVLGRTASGRQLTIPGVVFSEPPLEDYFMPATAREMDEAEHRLYQRHRG